MAATVLAGGVAAANSPSVSDALSEQSDWAWERLESVVPPLQVGEGRARWQGLELGSSKYSPSLVTVVQRAVRATNHSKGRSVYIV